LTIFSARRKALIVISPAEETESALALYLQVQAEMQLMTVAEEPS
jgi:hypothetical protein